VSAAGLHSLFHAALRQCWSRLLPAFHLRLGSRGTRGVGLGYPGMRRMHGVCLRRLSPLRIGCAARPHVCVSACMRLQVTGTLPLSFHFLRSLGVAAEGFRVAAGRCSTAGQHSPVFAALCRGWLQLAQPCCLRLYTLRSWEPRARGADRLSVPARGRREEKRVSVHHHTLRFYQWDDVVWCLSCLLRPRGGRGHVRACCAYK
jgi:hypothetical protein